MKVMVILLTFLMVVPGCDIYTTMLNYALSEGLTDFQAKFYADVYFDYWYLDKPITEVNIYGKFDCRGSKVG